MARKNTSDQRGRAVTGPLREYRSKRNLRRSGEPSGSGRTSGTGSRTSGTSRGRGAADKTEADGR